MKLELCRYTDGIILLFICLTAHTVCCTLKAKVAAEAKELDENKAKHHELTQNLRDGLNELREWQR